MDSEPTFVKVGVSLRERLKELNDSELRVLLALGLRIDEARQCWPKKTVLAEECTRSERQVQRSIGALIDKGFIWVGRRVGGRGKANIYTLNGYFAYGHAPVQLIAPILYGEKGDIGAPKTASRKRETSAQDQQLRGREAEKGDIDVQQRETSMEDEQLLAHERIKGDMGGGVEKGDIPDIKGDIGISGERETSAPREKGTINGSEQLLPHERIKGDMKVGRKVATKKNHIRRTIKEEDGEPLLSQATKYLFGKTGRKRWGNLVQKEKFEECESAVGSDRLIEAIDWALTSGITNVKSIITAARVGKKERSDSGTRVRPKPEQERRRPITRIPGD